MSIETVGLQPRPLPKISVNYQQIISSNHVQLEHIIEIPEIQSSLIVIIVLILAYHFGRPSLEQMLGMKLPALTGDNSAEVASEKDGGGDSSTNSSMDSAKSSSTPNMSSKPNDSSESKSKSASSKFELTPAGGQRLRSPAGLIYDMGPGGEHRVDHVMAHATDNPQRPVHSVFNGDRNEILAMIDEAYTMIKNGDRNVKKQKSDDYKDRFEYTIKMNKDVGYKGGRNGKRDNYPKLRSLRLILENDRVITAYPY
ncbi:MAG: hypothetical protein R3C03_12955 [Pirellulaceae bacterium]